MSKDQKRTLYQNQYGPLVQYEHGTLYIENLNPQVATKWRMSRMEMLRFGWKCIWGGLTRSDPSWNAYAKRAEA